MLLFGPSNTLKTIIAEICLLVSLISASYANSLEQEPFWGIQISDVHLSKFRFAQARADFEHLCRYDIKVFQPEVILVTGDLTDAKTYDMQGSRQYAEEWESYRSIVYNSGVLNATKRWLDIRGNHDAFNVLSSHSSSGYLYQNHRAPARERLPHTRSYKYMHQSSKSSQKICFIGVDATPNPGPRRPFNFFGVLSQDGLDELQTLSHQCSSETNTTMWFGHYPTSVIISPRPGLRHIMRDGVAYVCGHLHTMNDLVTNMYTRQRGGFLELELGDFKENRLIRLFAFDQGGFSFIDVPKGQWPVVLITNPGHALYTNLKFSQQSLLSKALRFLVFSTTRIQTITVSIDDVQFDVSSRGSQSSSPLFIVPWSPKRYSKGVHYISIVVKTADGKTTQIDQPFSFDGSVSGLRFRFFPQFMLMSDFMLLGRVLMIWFLSSIIVPLMFFRSFRGFVLASVSKFRCNGLCNPFCNWLRFLIHKFCLLAAVDSLFWPIVVYSVYIAVGPWFIGEVLEAHIGLLFSFGFYVNNSFIPTGLPHFIACLQYFTFMLPLVCHLGHVLQWRLLNSRDLDKSQGQTDVLTLNYSSKIPEVLHSVDSAGILSVLKFNWLLVLIILWEMFIAYKAYYLPYGLMAFLLSPVGLGTVLFALYTVGVALRISLYELEKINSVPAK